MDIVMKGADGKLYQETVNGEYVEYELPAGAETVELRDGSLGVKERERRPDDVRDEVESIMRDEEEYERQRQAHSHDEYFLRNQKQKLKRKDALQRQADQLTERVEPGTNAGIVYIKDEQCLDYLDTYRKAFEKGEHKQCDFQPLSTYEHKLRRVRPVLKGEVGIIGAMIQCLEGGYGGGAVISVDADISEDGE